MLTFIYIFQLIISVLLLLLIFVQKRQETTSLLSTNSYNSVFKSMAAPPNPLLKVTIVLGILFFINSILISALLLHRSKTDVSAVQKALEYAKTHPTQAKASTLPKVGPAANANRKQVQTAAYKKVKAHSTINERRYALKQHAKVQVANQHSVKAPVVDKS